MRSGWGWIGLGVVLGLTGGLVRGADPDPEAVRKLMEKYRRETAPPAAKPAPAPKPKPAPAHKPRPKPQPEPVEADSAPAPSAVPLPDMVRIAGGRFQMGSPETETERQPDEMRHEVTVKEFEMGRHEVTMGEFRRFVEASGYRTDAEKSGEGCYVWKDSQWQLTAGSSWRNPGFKQGDDHPVVCVSWNDAMAYIEWLSKATGQRYGLPTEAEWEYAARAGTATARHWGDDPDQACGYANVADQTLGWTPMHDCRDGYSYTAPVGSFQPNGRKLYDMLGNVWEWTCSSYAKDYDGSEARCSNKGTSAALAVRGGGWLGRPAWVRSANRDWTTPANRYNTQGFRLARSL